MIEQCSAKTCSSNVNKKLVVNRFGELINKYFVAETSKS